MPETKLNIEVVTRSQDVPLGLLKLADPSGIRINEYLKTGTCYVARMGAKMVGVLVLNQMDPTSMEVKNIAVKATEQGKGFGKALLRYAELISRERGVEKLVIGTGNSSVGQLALYQKEGFEICRIEKNFFTQNYAEPIFENGIQCKHMVILEKNLE